MRIEWLVVYGVLCARLVVVWWWSRARQVMWCMSDYWRLICVVGTVCRCVWGWRSGRVVVSVRSV